MPSLDVNFLAVSAAAVAAMVIGFLWYGPIFGKTWLAAMGKTPEEISGATGAYVISAVAALISALVLAIVLELVPRLDIVKGVVWGILLALGFVATTTLINGAYEGRNATVTVLFVTYQVVVFAAMGAIIAAFA